MKCIISTSFCTLKIWIKGFLNELILFQKGQSPLDIAVANKYVGIVELLCNFGSSVTIDDWALIDVDLHVLNKSDQRIMQALITQKEREAETENGYGKIEIYEYQVVIFSRFWIVLTRLSRVLSITYV